MSQTKIYIGRSVPGLTEGTIFSEGLPPHIQALTEELPHVRALIVPIDGLQQTRRKLNEKGSALNYHLQHLLDKEPNNGV